MNGWEVRGGWEGEEGIGSLIAMSVIIDEALQVIVRTIFAKGL